MQPVFGCLLLLAILVAVVLLTVGAVALMRRGRDNVRGSGSLGSAMQELESLFVESKRHVIEAEKREEAEESPSGDPPEKDQAERFHSGPRAGVILTGCEEMWRGLQSAPRDESRPTFLHSL